MKNWEAEKQRREQSKANRQASDKRADQFSSHWEEWTPEEAARHFKDDLGAAVFGVRLPSADSAKIIYRNLHTGWTIAVDVHNRYFTVHCPKLLNGRIEQMYVSKDGNVSLNGRANGFHFRIPTKP